MAVAGHGADEQARRARARSQRLRKELSAAELRERLERSERAEHAWAAGAEGERLVAQTLEELEGWHVLHDVRWPGRPKANIDHIAVGPGGVVVIDAKNWARAEVAAGVLRSGGYRKDRELESLARAVTAVAAVIAPDVQMTVQGVLCLAAQDVPATRTPQGVVVVGRGQLLRHLRTLEPRLAPERITTTAANLRAALDGRRSPESATTPKPRSRGRQRRVKRDPIPGLLMRVGVAAFAVYCFARLLEGLPG